MAIPTMSDKDECSWLHVAVKYKGTPLEVIQFYVDIGGKELLLMQSDYHFGRTAMHIAVSIHGTQEIIELFLKVGGLELWDITDNGGFQVIDYCDKAEREVFINSLRSMQSNSNLPVHKYLERFEASTITPKEVESGELDTHLACKGDFDTQNRREVVKFLIDHIGADLIHEVNCDNETALHKLICCPIVKFDRDLIIPFGR